MSQRLHHPIMSRTLCVTFVLASVLCGTASAADRDVDAALKAMDAEIADVRKSCNEPIAIEAHEVALSDRVTGMHVVLKEGTCLGFWGQYDYLLVEHPDGHWQMVK